MQINVENDDRVTVHLSANVHTPSATLLSQNLRLRQNNFDLLRFFFAFVVFLFHAYVLSGVDILSGLSSFVFADLAVKSFFVVSGFLIFMSYENSRDTPSYLLKRIRRIYPAYFFILMVSAVFGSIFSTYPWDDYFSLQLFKYITANLVFLNFLQPTLPGLFEGNRLQTVNGALWTLKIEVMFYLLVPLVVMAFRQFGRLPMLSTLYISSVIYSMVMQGLVDKTGSSLYLELQKQLPGQIAFFVAGAAGYYYLHYLKKYAIGLIVLSVAAFAFQSWLPWVAFQPAALGILVVGFACVIPSLGKFDKYGDFSYGIYIIHFPILQAVIAFGLFKESPWTLLLVSTALVMITAFLLWHFIEKPFLRKPSPYVAKKYG